MTELQPFQEISQQEADELMLSVPGVALNIQDHFQHILKQDVTLDAEPFSTIPAGTPIFGEEQKGFIVFQFGEYKRQIPKTHF
jgi:hypothetical protein